MPRQPEPLLGTQAHTHTPHTHTHTEENFNKYARAGKKRDSLPEGWWDDDLARAAHLEPLQAQVQALDDTASALAEGEGLGALERRVEQRAVGEHPLVRQLHHRAQLRLGLCERYHVYEC